MGPCGFEGFRYAVGIEAKVKLDIVGGGRALAGGLAEELPSRVAGEAVGGQLGGGFVTRSGAKDLEQVRNCM